MSQVKLEAVVGRIRGLPTLPTVVTRLMQVVDSPASTAADVAKVVASDQSLMARVLRIVNSAFYGLPRRVSTLTQATVLLGMNAIKNMALSVTVFDTFGSDTEGDALFSREQFWYHSLGAAAAAKVLARQLRYPVPEEAFMAGLIHDIGKVAIDQYLHSSFTDIVRKVREQDLSMRQAEIQVLGVDHSEIGLWIAEKWNLPPQLVEAVGYHHRPTQARRAPKLTAVVALADALARWEKLGSGGDSVEPVVHETAWERLHLRPEEVENLKPEIRQEYEKANIFLRLASHSTETPQEAVAVEAE